MKQISGLLLASLALLPSAPLLADSKHVEDPTKIVTRGSLGYDNGFTVSGSIGLDDTRMVSGSYNEGTGDWSTSGSWLFEKGIVNFYFNGNEGRHSYSVGTYVPLAALGVNTGQWMVFPMAGATIIDGKGQSELNYGGYLGAFAIRPITEQIAFVTYGSGALASGDYTSLSAGAGASYKFTEVDSVRLMASASRDTYSTTDKLSISYSREF